MATKERLIKFEDKQCEVKIPQEFRNALKLKKGRGDSIAWVLNEETKELFGYFIKGKKRKRKEK